MSTMPRCPKCGAQLLEDAPAGLCPQCLVEAGLESEPAVSGEGERTTPYTPSGGPFVPPKPKELAERFVELEILELIGTGGMGAVYKARQKELDRLVAVKILPPEVGAAPTFAERFSREAKALARLGHPNIVAVYDAGQRDGLFYFVMELVDGVNLRAAMHAGQLGTQQALSIVTQICAALQYAHDAGIVHRDIKPENVLLTQEGRVKIADFGLAKLVREAAPDVSLTATAQVMGTFSYMAPEQLEGIAHIDHRADIYSLGVVFYELLTGEVPMGRFAPPSQKVQVDVRLDEVVLRSLEREPEKRYQRASDMKTDIESLPKEAHVGPSNVASPARLPGEVDIETARQAVIGPAIGLMIVGFVNLLPLVLLVLFVFVRVYRSRAPFPIPELTLIQPSALPFGSAVLAQTLGYSGVILAETIVSVQTDAAPTRGYYWGRILPLAGMLLTLPIAGVLILGGWKMRKLDLYWLAVMASILSLLPCHPGFVIGLPIGIWSLMVLMQPDVKAAFGKPTVGVAWEDPDHRESDEPRI